MLDASFIRYLIQDILVTEEYSLEGIACYAHLPLDLVLDLATGYNEHPSLESSRRIIELHRSVRPILYKEIMDKIKVEIWS